MTDLQNKAFEYIKNPFVCALIISISAYYFYSHNYITKNNIKERISLKIQRTMNLKACLYVFFVSVIILFFFRYASTEIETDYQMLGGYAPF